MSSPDLSLEQLFAEAKAAMKVKGDQARQKPIDMKGRGDFE